MYFMSLFVIFGCRAIFDTLCWESFAQYQVKFAGQKEHGNIITTLLYNYKDFANINMQTLMCIRGQPIFKADWISGDRQVVNRCQVSGVRPL